MTKEQLAEQLNGNERGREITKELEAQAKADGLVVVFGYSDDYAELRGAIQGEVGCYDGGTIRVTSQGLLESDCDNKACPYFEELAEKAAEIEAIWCADEVYSWTYDTCIPHATFEIVENDGEGKFCRGIVFALADVLLHETIK